MYTITLQGKGSKNVQAADHTVLILYDAKGNEIARSDAGSRSSSSSTIDFIAPANDVYFLSAGVNPVDKKKDYSGHYEIKVYESKPQDKDDGIIIKGTDAPEVIEGGKGNDLLDGFGGDDTIYGYGGDDTITGGDGDDGLVGGPGADKLDGGNGFDGVLYFDSPAAVKINLLHRTARGGDAEGDRIGPDIEGVQGSDFDDELTGNDGANLILGGGGDDVINGLGDNDSLLGEAGDDRINGGKNDDVLVGGEGDDSLFGQDGDDFLLGEAGNDYLNGGNGDDWLIGEAGNDKLNGGDGNDLLTAALALMN